MSKRKSRKKKKVSAGHKLSKKNIKVAVTALKANDKQPVMTPDKLEKAFERDDSQVVTQRVGKMTDHRMKTVTSKIVTKILRCAVICKACMQHGFYLERFPKGTDRIRGYDKKGELLTGALTCRHCKKPMMPKLVDIVTLKK